MLCSLALAVLLPAVPAQAGELKLTNIRMTVGEFGPTRANAKLLPGDILFISYDITGLPIDPEGIAKYRMSMEVKETAGKSIFKQDPRDLGDFIPLRGNSIPARAFVTIGLDQEPGNYICTVTVEDPKSKAKDTFTSKFDVLKKELGIVAVHTTHDRRGEFSAPTVGCVGQTIYMNFSVASFQRDLKTKQPKVQVEYQLFDDKGQPTLGKPISHTQDDGVDEKEGAFPMSFPLFMSRPGKFTVKVTATDKIAGKTVTYELPVTVLPPN